MDLTLINPEEIVAENIKLKGEMQRMILQLKNLQKKNAELTKMMMASVEANAEMFRQTFYQKQRADTLQNINNELVIVQ